jgi:hypothetical protein
MEKQKQGTSNLVREIKRKNHWLFFWKKRYNLV